MIESLTLKTVAFNDQATQGVLVHKSRALFVTLEDPWLNNQVGISCIPAGVYRCVRHSSPAHPDTWRLENVPGRTAILIHNGNTMMDTQGCILIGKMFGTLGELPAAQRSVEAMIEFRQMVKAWTEFDLTVDRGDYGKDRRIA